MTELDRETLKVGLTVVRHIDDPSNDHIVIESDPTIGPLANADRSGRRAVGVAQGRRSEDHHKPVADGWDFEGQADLGKLVNDKGTSGPPYPPFRGSIEPETRSFWPSARHCGRSRFG